MDEIRHIIWKIIFKWTMYHSYVSLREGTVWVNNNIRQRRKSWSMWWINVLGQTRRLFRKRIPQRVVVWTYGGTRIWEIWMPQNPQRFSLPPVCMRGSPKSGKIALALMQILFHLKSDTGIAQIRIESASIDPYYLISAGILQALHHVFSYFFPHGAPPVCKSSTAKTANKIGPILQNLQVITRRSSSSGKPPGTSSSKEASGPK